MSVPDAENAARLLERAETLIDLGRHSAALPVVADALRLAPDSVRAYCVLALALRELGQYRQSLAVLNDALRVDPNYEWAHRLRAFNYRSVGDMRSLAAAREAHRLEPETWQSGYTLAATLLDFRQYDQAESAIQRVLALEPNNAAVFDLMGQLALKRNQPLKAETHYREALRADPAAAYAHTGLGEALLRQDRFDEATRAFNQALTIDPTAHDAQQRMYESALSLRRRNPLSTSRRLLGRISPRLYQHFVLREQKSFRVFFFVFLAKIALPVCAMSALLAWAMHALLDGNAWSAFAWSAIGINTVLLAAARFGWASTYLDIGDRHVRWVSPLSAWILSPGTLLLIGFAGLQFDERRWPLHALVVICGIVFTGRLLWGIARGWYYRLAARWYTRIATRQAVLSDRLRQTRYGRVLLVAWKVISNPVLYLLAGLVGLLTQEKENWFPWLLLSMFGWSFTIVMGMRRWTRWKEKRGAIIRSRPVPQTQK